MYWQKWNVIFIILLLLAYKYQKPRIMFSLHRIRILYLQREWVLCELPRLASLQALKQRDALGPEKTPVIFHCERSCCKTVGTSFEGHNPDGMTPHTIRI